ncbi:hypothetical protein CSIV_02010 [Microbacterium sp. CSI-V]|nr:hypothetical protein [Microbacterium sp. TL13]ONI66410.1 hypothetical protein CSIV_02010 [Microbacterium sp. CSI-V]
MISLTPAGCKADRTDRIRYALARFVPSAVRPHLLTMGLHDLVETPTTLARRRNPVADRFAAHASRGAR